MTNPVLTRLAMGALFPFGLLITLVCGAELYTGNTALVTAAVMEGKADAQVPHFGSTVYARQGYGTVPTRYHRAFTNNYLNIWESGL